MNTNPADPFVGMTAEDAARARAFQDNQRAIQRRREAHARALLAPPGPAQAVREAWAPVTAPRPSRAPGGAT